MPKSRGRKKNKQSSKNVKTSIIGELEKTAQPKACIVQKCNWCVGWIRKKAVQLKVCVIQKCNWCADWIKKTDKHPIYILLQILTTVAAAITLWTNISADPYIDFFDVQTDQPFSIPFKLHNNSILLPIKNIKISCVVNDAYNDQHVIFRHNKIINMATDENNPAAREVGDYICPFDKAFNISGKMLYVNAALEVDYQTYYFVPKHIVFNNLNWHSETHLWSKDRELQ